MSTPTSPISLHTVEPQITEPSQDNRQERAERPSSRSSKGSRAERSEFDELRPRSASTEPPVAESSSIRRRASLPDVLPGSTDAVEIASPQVSEAQATLPRDLAGLQDRLNGQKSKHLDLNLLAGVLNEVRPDLLHRAGHGTLPGNHELVNRITKDQIGRFRAALARAPEEVKQRESVAYWAGLFIPSSSSTFNMVNYLVVPFATQHIENPWIAASLSLGLVGLQPFITAPLQSLVIGTIDYYRGFGSPELKLDKASINSAASQSAIKGEIESGIESAQASERAVVALFKRHDVVGDDDLIDPARLSARLSGQSLSPADKKELIDACKAHLDALMALCASASQMNALDGSHARQIESTLMQIAPRALRSGSGIVAPFIREPGPQAPPSKFDNLVGRKLSPLHVTGVSAGIAMVAIVLQHLAAARDEVNGLRLEEKLNMLHADVFNEGGREAAYRRGAITPDDLSMEKCRGLSVSAEATMVLRVADRLEADLPKLRRELERQQSAPVSPGALEEGAAYGDPALRSKIEAYERDVNNLRDLTVTNDLHEDTQALLKSALNGSLSFAWGEAYAKLTKPLELTSQISQRLGQTFTLGVLGSASATAGGRLASAALGGTSHISLAVQFYLSVASMAIGVFSAATQGLVTNVKNQRRDAEPEDAMGFWTQMLKGASAPVLWGNNLWRSWQGRHEAGHAFEQFQEQARRVGECFARLDEAATADESDPRDHGDDASTAAHQSAPPADAH